MVVYCQRTRPPLTLPSLYFIFPIILPYPGTDQFVYLLFAAVVGKNATRFALCYWHAVALSRRGFGPIGWSSRYSFGTSDLRMSQKVLLTVMLSRSKHSHADLVGLQHLVGHIVYGGHIVDAFDRRLCLTYVHRLLTEKVVFNEANCYLASPEREEHGFEGFLCPNVDDDEGYADKAANYVTSSGERVEKFGPLLLGMHPNTAIGLMQSESTNILGTMRSLLTLNEGLGGGGNGGGDGVKDAVSMVDTDELLATIEVVLDDLPHVGGGGSSSGTGDSMHGGGQTSLEGRGMGSVGLGGKKDASGRRASPGTFGFLYKRERRNLVEGVAFVREDLRKAESACQGKTLADDGTNLIILTIAKGRAPRSWAQAMSPDGTVVPMESQMLTAWVKRICRVHEFQSEWAEAVIRKPSGIPPLVDLSCVLNPRALLAAICLIGARTSGKSLENITLGSEITNRRAKGITMSPQGGGLFVTGFQLESAVWNTTVQPPVLSQVTTRQPRSNLPVIHLFAEDTDLVKKREIMKKKRKQRRLDKASGDGRQFEDEDKDEDEEISGLEAARGEYVCPVYANSFRGRSHLFDLVMPVKTADEDSEKWVLEGVAVILESATQ
jgi:dynein heavy chain